MNPYETTSLISPQIAQDYRQTHGKNHMFAQKSAGLEKPALLKNLILFGFAHRVTKQSPPAFFNWLQI